MQRTWMACPAMQCMDVGILLELLQIQSLPFQDSLDFHVLISTYSKVIFGPGKEKKGTLQLGYVERVYKVVARQEVGEP